MKISTDRKDKETKAMIEDISCPKEKFLVDLFESKKQKVSETSSSEFDSILNNVQLKIEKRSIDSLLKSDEKTADESIDRMTPRESVELLKQSADIIRTS